MWLKSKDFSVLNFEESKPACFLLIEFKICRLFYIYELEKQKAIQEEKLHGEVPVLKLYTCQIIQSFDVFF